MTNEQNHKKVLDALARSVRHSRIGTSCYHLDGSGLHYLDSVAIYFSFDAATDVLVCDCHPGTGYLNWDLPSTDPRAPQIRQIVEQEITSWLKSEAMKDLAHE
jgi:hypothetical protein